jgi:hypothetical protein
LVTVADGKLTLSNGPTSANNKVAFIDVYAAGQVSGEAPVLETTINSNGLTITCTGGGVLQETTDLGSANWTPVDGSPQGSYTTPVTAPHKFYRVVLP